MEPVKVQALVFGGSGGIGSAIIKRMRDGGYHVDAPSRTDCDLADPAGLHEYLSSSKFRPSVIVYAAGYNTPMAATEVSLPQIQMALQINALSPFQIFQHFIQQQMELGTASNVLISSSYAGKSVPGRLPYSASKATAESLVRSLALETASHGIRYNIVRPGFIDTEMTNRNNSPTAKMDLISKIPMCRLGESSEVAELVWHLVSSASAYSTGGTFTVDGGYCVT